MISRQTETSIGKEFLQISNLGVLSKNFEALGNFGGKKTVLSFNLALPYTATSSHNSSWFPPDHKPRIPHEGT